MEPSHQNMTQDPLLNSPDADPDAFISYDQHSSLRASSWIDDILFKAYESNENQQEQKIMSVTDAPGENFTHPLESQFQTELDRRPDGSDPQRNHNEFCEIQDSKSSELCNNNTHFDEETHCFSHQSKPFSENQDFPIKDGHFPTLSSSDMEQPLHISNRAFAGDCGLGVPNIQSAAFPGIPLDETLTRKIQQENVQPRQPLKNNPPQRGDPAESDESLPRAAPSKKLKVESPHTNSTAGSTIGTTGSNDSLEKTFQAENYNDGLNGSDTSSPGPLEEKHGQGVNEQALNNEGTEKGFQPHRSAIKTIPNSILRFLQNNVVFRKFIEKEVCQKYKIPTRNIETYIEFNVKGCVVNETQLSNAIGNCGPKKADSHLLNKEQAKRATWLVFQIFLGCDGHFERWIDDAVYGYQPLSKLAKGEKRDDKDPKYLAKQEEKREIYKKEGLREKLRKIFEDSRLPACPGKGRKKDNSEKKTSPKKKDRSGKKTRSKKKEQKKEEYISFEEILIEEIVEDQHN